MQTENPENCGVYDPDKLDIFLACSCLERRLLEVDREDSRTEAGTVAYLGEPEQ